ncbi:MAG: hypothetical protein ACE37E_06745 [Hyphomicrobiales bacterium]
MNLWEKIAAVALNAVIPFLGNLAFEAVGGPKRLLVTMFVLFSTFYVLVDENNLILGSYQISNLTTVATVVVLLGFAWSSIWVLGESKRTSFNFRFFTVGSAVAALGVVLHFQMPVDVRVPANTLAPFIEVDDVITYRDEAEDRVGGLRLVLGPPSSPDENKVGFAIAEAGDVVSLIDGTPAICSRQQSLFACRPITNVCEFLNAEPTIQDGEIDIAFEVQNGEIMIATWPLIDGVDSLQYLTVAFDRVFLIERIFRSGEGFSRGERVPVYGCFDP